MVEPIIIDFASSPHLSIIREIAGEEAAQALVRKKGGTSVYVPIHPKKEHVLAKIVGIKAALKISERFGLETLEISNGRGLSHARRIDPAEAVALADTGLSCRKIADRLDCTSRNIRKILEIERGRRLDRARHEARRQRRNEGLNP